MGVKRFQGGFLKNKVSPYYPSIFSRPSGVNSVLAIDGNGLLHTTAQEVYAYGPRTTEATIKSIHQQRQRLIDEHGELEGIARFDDMMNERYYQKLTEKVEEFHRYFKPSEHVIFAIDGVPPRAKIYQQIQRQFKSSQDSLPEFFNPANIKPGTEWMFKLTSKLRDWAIDKKYKLITHTNPGEGEHKLFIELKKYTLQDDGNIIIMGKDSDLKIISLLSGFEKVYVNLEDFTNFVNIDVLKQYLKERIRFDGDQRENGVYTDFALLSTFVGNDFLPSLHLFHDYDALEFLLSVCYRSLAVPLTESNNQIIWKNFRKLINYVSEQYVSFIIPIIENNQEYQYPSDMIEESISNDEFDADKFRELWYDRIFLPRTNQGKKLMEEWGIKYNREEEVQELVEKYLYGLQWVLNYYTNPENFNQSFYFNHPYAPLIEDINTYGDIKYTLEDVKTPPLEKYNTGYVKDLRERLANLPNKSEEFKNQNEYDKYKAKLEVKIDKYKKKFSKKNRLIRSSNKYFNIYEQMLYITPPPSYNLLPEEVKKTLIDKYAYLSPAKIIRDMDGVNEQWEAVAIVPDPQFNFISQFKRIPKRYTEFSDTLVMGRLAEAPAKAYVRGQHGGRGEGRGQQRGGRGQQRGGRGQQRGGEGRGRGGRGLERKPQVEQGILPLPLAPPPMMGRGGFPPPMMGRGGIRRGDY